MPEDADGWQVDALLEAVLNPCAGVRTVTAKVKGNMHNAGVNMNSAISPVELAKAYRLVNHGPTVLVSACHDGVEDVMAAAWCCALDFAPPKLTVVLDKATKTRELLENSGYFAIQVPTAAQLELTNQVAASACGITRASWRTARWSCFAPANRMFRWLPVAPPGCCAN